MFSQGSSDRDAFKPYFEYTAGLLYYLGFDVLEMVIAAGTDNLKVSFRPKLLENARELGSLVSTSSLTVPEFRKGESSLA
ncbi:hypothetical protein [Methanosarcina barkeri]|uniref:hypothetical protein n=1 Tax=Methanosarcina barkeri TaxID=2208 RepID=UPI000B205F35|nr:hypothetical protein [Methanosarcina barkeri]